MSFTNEYLFLSPHNAVPIAVPIAVPVPIVFLHHVSFECGPFFVHEKLVFFAERLDEALRLHATRIQEEGLVGHPRRLEERDELDHGQ